MKCYKFEGTVKSTMTSTGVEFTIEPTSKYTIKSSSCGKEVKDYVAFDYDAGQSKMIDKSSLRVYSARIPICVSMWFNAHSDTDKSVTFTVDNRGRLCVQRRLKIRCVR